MRSRKLGLMGCGVIALGRHVPAIFRTHGLELHAVCEPDGGRRRRATEDLGVPHAFADPEAFLDSGIEAVSVVSPAPFHEENVVAAAGHRLPVLCEKPLAPDGAGARRMIAAMQAAGAPLFTAFCYRFSPSESRGFWGRRTTGCARSRSPARRPRRPGAGAPRRRRPRSAERGRPPTAEARPRTRPGARGRRGRRAPPRR